MSSILLNSPTETMKAVAAVDTPHNNSPNVLALKQLVRSLYDFQKVRISVGNRLCTLLRRRLGQGPSEKAEDTLDPKVLALLKEIREVHVLLGTAVAVEGIASIEGQAARLQEDEAEAPGLPENEDDTAGDESIDPAQAKAAAKAAKKLAALSAKITAAVSVEVARQTEKRKRFVTLKQFEPSVILSSFAEFQLAVQYIDAEKNEASYIRRLEDILETFPIYNDFLLTIKGCGIMMSAVIISTMDPYKARYVSSFWKYVGLDVVNGTQDGKPWSEGRGKYDYHLGNREVMRRNGKMETKRSVTFAPDLKTKIVGVLSGCLLKAGMAKTQVGTDDKGKPIKEIVYDECTAYVKTYLDYKNRMVNHAVYGTHNDGKPDILRNVRFSELSRDRSAVSKFTITSPGRRNRMALRYMMKMFLKDLYIAWRTVEGLEVHPSYQEAKLGHTHGGAK